MKIISSCPICGKYIKTKKQGLIASFIAQRVLEKKPHEFVWCGILYCHHCDFIFSDMRFDEDEMKKLYTDYRAESYNRQRLNIEPSYHAFLINQEENIQIRKSALYKFLHNFGFHKIKSVLDYGGDGKIIPEEAFPYARFFHYEAYKGMEKPHQADFVFCTHVLEHVTDPASVLSQVRKLSVSGVYLEVPYGFTDSRNANNISVHEHINFFTENSLRKLVEKCDFQITILETFRLCLAGDSATFIRCLAV